MTTPDIATFIRATPAIATCRPAYLAGSLLDMNITLGFISLLPEVMVGRNQREWIARLSVTKVLLATFKSFMICGFLHLAKHFYLILEN
jgi:hypothetical protein